MWSETCWRIFYCVSFRLLNHTDVIFYDCVNWMHLLVIKSAIKNAARWKPEINVDWNWRLSARWGILLLDYANGKLFDDAAKGRLRPWNCVVLWVSGGYRTAKLQIGLWALSAEFVSALWFVVKAYSLLNIVFVLLNWLKLWTVLSVNRSRWCHCEFFSWFPRNNHVNWGRIRNLKMSTRDLSWGKSGPYLGWQTTTLLVPKVLKIQDLKLPGTPWATSACRGTPLFYSI